MVNRCLGKKAVILILLELQRTNIAYALQVNSYLFNTKDYLYEDKVCRGLAIEIDFISHLL